MKFSVLSYNVLHGTGAARLLRGRPSGSPAWAQDRLVRAAELVQQLAPDVACLQEVCPVAEAALERVLGEDYARAAVYRNEELPPKDGCATFVRKSRLEVVRTHSFRLRDSAERHFPAAAEIRGRAAGFASALWRELHEKLTLSVALQLRPVAGGADAPSRDSGSAGANDFCVATSHLYWDPRYPDLKLLQAYLLAQELERFAGELPLVLAGDLNSTPLADGRSSGEGELSGVYSLLMRGVVDIRHPHHP
ncbi:unnamed protein product, partial [Polarella glacialis]